MQPVKFLKFLRQFVVLVERNLQLIWNDKLLLASLTLQSPFMVLVVKLTADPNCFTSNLVNIGGGQVDGNMAGGPGTVQVFDGAAYPLTAFLHGGIRQAHHGKFGQTAADVGFHGNGVAIQPRYPQADNVCIHGAANSFFQQIAYFDYFQYILFRPRRQAYFLCPKSALTL